MDRGAWQATVHTWGLKASDKIEATQHAQMYVYMLILFIKLRFLYLHNRKIYIYISIHLTNYICALNLCLNFTNSEKMKNYIIEISRVWNYSLILYRYLHYKSLIFVSYLTFSSLWTCQLYLYFWINTLISLFF